MKLHFGFLRSFPLLPPLPPADNPKLVNILSLQKFFLFFIFFNATCFAYFINSAQISAFSDHSASFPRIFSPFFVVFVLFSLFCCDTAGI